MFLRRLGILMFMFISIQVYQDFPRQIFQNWEKESEGVGEGLVRTWTG